MALALFGRILPARGRDLDALRMSGRAWRPGRPDADHGVTAAAGPIAFVAGLSGPLASRLVGPNGSIPITAPLVGACRVLVDPISGKPMALPRHRVTGT